MSQGGRRAEPNAVQVSGGRASNADSQALPRIAESGALGAGPAFRSNKPFWYCDGGVPGQLGTPVHPADLLSLHQPTPSPVYPVLLLFLLHLPQPLTIFCCHSVPHQRRPSLPPTAVPSVSDFPFLWLYVCFPNSKITESFLHLFDDLTSTPNSSLSTECHVALGPGDVGTQS